MSVYIGIDWSATKHDVCVVNEAGTSVAALVLPHTADGLLKLETLRHQLCVAPQDSLVGIETAHSLVIAFLWARQYTQRQQVRELQELFEQHPDSAIFTSLPGAGAILAPALLAQFGDDRERFPTAESVQALAGTCPVTEQSGKRRSVTFRTACNHHFRDIAQQWAKASLKQSAWAQAYWQQTRPHCHSESHAYRCLAKRWLAIAWRLWQSHQAYDEAYHLQQRVQRRQARG